MPRPKLGVNVDHVATLRQARGTDYPDPVDAARIAENAGADQITVHLREDRRHIVDRDVHLLRKVVQTRLNLEMAATDEMVGIALEIRPDMVTLVPERREERTTEGGLDVVAGAEALRQRIARLSDAGLVVSLFIDPDEGQIRATRSVGAPMIELHTGDYADTTEAADRDREFGAIAGGARFADEIGLVVAAGHGLHRDNLAPLLEIDTIVEYNIGHSIVARAVFVGFERAVGEILDVLDRGRDQQAG